MIQYRLGVANDDIIYDTDGNKVGGSKFVGEDNIVRWFSQEDQAGMEGIGKQLGYGYAMYQDDPAISNRQPA
jgi:hypothetical protein